MSTLTWLLVGIGTGLLFSLGLRLLGQPLVRGHIYVGILGAFAAGVFIAPLFGVEIVTQKVFSYPSMFVSLGGAVVLIAAVYLFQRQRLAAADRLTALSESG